MALWPFKDLVLFVSFVVQKLPPGSYHIFSSTLFLVLTIAAAATVKLSIG
jgi:hypothetical protein